MKKAISLALIMITVLCLSAEAYNPGTYTSAAKGIGGNIEVSVTFDADKITDIKVINHAETPGIGEVALEKMIPEMLSAQSTNVDGMTGATITSNALREAVQNCITMASEAGIY